MKLFLTRKEKQEFKQLRKIERSNSRRLTYEEFCKIERVETFIANRRPLFISILALLLSLASVISKSVL